MLGLIESAARKLDYVSLSVNAAVGQVSCATKNHIVEKQYERKHKKCQKNISEAEAKKSKEAKDLIDKTIKALSEDNLLEVQQMLNTDLEAFKTAVAGASEEQFAELSTYMSKLDALAGIVLSVRTQAAHAIGQGGMPIFYPANGGKLAQQAAQQGGVNGRDIVNNFRGQDIQHANPQGINNPVPVTP